MPSAETQESREQTDDQLRDDGQDEPKQAQQDDNADLQDLQNLQSNKNDQSDDMKKPGDEVRKTSSMKIQDIFNEDGAESGVQLSQEIVVGGGGDIQM